MALLLGWTGLLLSLLVYGGQSADESSQKWSNICPEDKCRTIDLSHHKNEIILKTNRIFCIKPLTRSSLKGLLHIWHKMEIRHNNSKGSILVTDNSTEFVSKKILDEDIVEDIGSSGSFQQKNDAFVLELSPFDTNCVGVRNSSPPKIGIGGKYIITFSRRLLFYRPVFLLFALLLFYSAPVSTRNPKYYYFSVIAIGILVSLLIWLHICDQLKKIIDYIVHLSVQLEGHTFADYFAYSIYPRLIVDYLYSNWPNLLICFMITASCITLAILYTCSIHTLQLIQWPLQFISLIFLCFSFSEIPVIADIAVLGLLVHYNTSLSIPRLLKSLFYRMFSFLKPETKIKLLTAKEYEEQGRFETKKALKKLCEYCQSDRNFWDKKLEKISNQSRLFEFMVSGKDCTDSQREAHEREYSSWYDGSDDDDVYQ